MELKRFFPSRSSYSTPEIAQKLLTLVAWMLLFCMISTAIIYLKSCFNEEVSMRRRQMNDAVYNARIYLFQREMLLVHLGHTSTYLTPDRVLATPPSDPLKPEQRIRMSLSPSTRWSILISGRDIREIESQGGGLIYVAPETPFAVSDLFGRVNHSHAVPTFVLEQLINNKAVVNDYSTHWLSDPEDPLSRIYLFIRVSPSSRAGWLGFELNGAQASEVLSNNQGLQFLLFNQDRKLVLSSDLENRISSPDFLPEWKKDSFTFSSNGLLPGDISLSKHIGSSNWTLVYYINPWTLLNTLWLPMIFSTLFCLFGGILIWLTVKRINEHWIFPAYQNLYALVKSETFTRALLQSAPVGLCALDKNCDLPILENDRARDWLGSPHDRPEALSGQIIEALDGTSMEITANDSRPLQLSASHIDHHGNDVVFAALTDISTLKQTERLLVSARQTAETASKAKTIFLATMSHEIRTPLYGVLGTLELLSLTQLNAQQESYLQTIQRSSTALHQLINDVLDISKIEAGQLVLDPIEFNPLDLIQDAVYSYSATAKRKNVQLYACCDPRLPYHVKGDAARIRQILNNLLSNAIKFTDSGRVVIRLKVENRDGERINLSWQVTDTGIGISAEDQRYLFDPFYQTRGQSSSTGGTGLGLSICQRLTQLMNGDLRVISEKGLGSSFTLLLPLELTAQEATGEHAIHLKPEQVYVRAGVAELAETVTGWLVRWGAHAQVMTSEGVIINNAILLELFPEGGFQLSPWQGPHVVATEEGYSEPQLIDNIWHVNLHSLYAIGRTVHIIQTGIQEPEHAQGANMAPRNLNLRVLVAEDNPINQLVLKEQLESFGCNVALASDGVEALDLWQPGAFDVVLTDINMPRMNGCDLAQNLRERGCNIPIIGATANAVQEESERCIKAGMNFCLVKPVGLSSLFGSLSALGTKIGNEIVQNPDR